METKTCIKCKIEKPIGEFYKDKRRKDGLHGWCKTCVILTVKQYQGTEEGKRIHLKSLIKCVRRYKQTEKGKEVELKSKNKYRRTYSGASVQLKAHIKIAERIGSKNSAHKAVYYARKLGILVPEPCPFCGKTAVQGHHENYRKPLNVEWLCQKHHSGVHN